MISYDEPSYQPGDPYNFQLTLGHLLNAGVRFAANKEIVYRDLVRYNYSTLEERVNRLAGALTALGIKKGDTVAVVEWDSHRYLECLFAIPMIGAVIHTINFRLSPNQLIYTMNHAGDKAVLVNSEFVPLFEGIANKLETVKHYVLMTDTAEKPGGSLGFAGEYEELLGNASASFKFPVLDENTEATTFYTTGTTGLPKGVHFTHRQLMLHTLVQCATMGAITSPGRVHSDDVYMPITPMFHVHAWGVPYTSTMLGLKQVYPGKYEPAMLLNLIVKEHVTVSHCVPTIIHMLVNSPVAGVVDLSHWKVVIGGSALPKGLAMAARKLGIEIYAGYGMSETGPLISIGNLKETMLEWPEEQKIDVAIKAGFPAALTEAKVVDPAGNGLPLDGSSQGELVLRAPWLTKDYSRDPERTKDLWVDGWMHTGDVAYIDDEGYINITDRIKDVIKSGGEWISSLEMEDMLSQFEGVSESAVIGVPDTKWGERPAAFVVLKPEYAGKVTAEAIREYLLKQSEAGKLSKWAVPERVEFLEALPKTSVGKIAKRELRAQFT